LPALSCPKTCEHFPARPRKIEEADDKKSRRTRLLARGRDFEQLRGLEYTLRELSAPDTTPPPAKFRVQTQAGVQQLDRLIFGYNSANEN